MAVAERTRPARETRRYALPANIEERLALYAETEEDRHAFPDVKMPGFVRVVKYMVSPGGRAGQAKIRAPHAFDIAMVTSSPGEGPPLHMHVYPEVFTGFSGKYGIVWGNGGEHCVELGALDTFSVPPNVMRQVMNLSQDPTGTSMAVWDHHDPKNAVYHTREVVEKELAEGKRTGRKIGIGAMMPPQEMEKYIARRTEVWRDEYILDRDAHPERAGVTTVVLSPRHLAGHARIAEPHSYHMLYSRLSPGDASTTYSRAYSEVFIGAEGRTSVALGARGEHRVELGMLDTISVPPGMPRRVSNQGREPSIVITMLDTPASPHGPF